MAMASSTARWLSTGSDPGRPRQTGQTLVLGSSPNMLGHPQNSLVAVLSSQWTSSPMTISHPGFMTGPSAADRPAAARGGAAASTTAATLNRVLSDRAGPSSCTPTGRPSSPGAEGDADGRVPGQVGGDGAHVGEVHGQRVAGLGPEGEGGGGGGGAEQDVAALVGGGEALDDPGPDPQGLVVIGVHVSGRQHIGAEHDPALDLGAEAGRPGGGVHGHGVLGVDPQPVADAVVAGQVGGGLARGDQVVGGEPEDHLRDRDLRPPGRRPRRRPRPPGGPGRPRRGRPPPGIR